MSNFIRFLAVKEDGIRSWHMNGGGDGPTFEVELWRSAAGWLMKLKEHPPDTEQQVEVP